MLNAILGGLFILTIHIIQLWCSIAIKVCLHFMLTLDNVLTNDLAVRRSIPGLPGRAVIYKGKHIDNSNSESAGTRQFDNVKLKCYLAASADEMDS